jgi:hypothetical protein
MDEIRLASGGAMQAGNTDVHPQTLYAEKTQLSTFFFLRF